MILMNDFKAESPQIREAMLAAAQRVLASGWYVLGEEVINFERQWAGICGVAHGVGVGNGMDAIEIILRASNIGPGDEVITTPMTAFATVLAILRAGATPVLADIDAHTGLLSLQSTQRCLSRNTRAILLVHLYGQVRQMHEWADFCRSHQIDLIEDCAQAHLAEWQGQVAGSFGTAGAYSFYPTKNLGAAGDAGMLVTDNEELAQSASQLRNYGQSVRYQHPRIGLNSRLDEIHAAMLAVRLNYLREHTQCRQRIAARYRDGMTNPAVRLLSLPEEPGAQVYHLFVVNCDQRDALQAHLQENEVQSLIHYPIPIHQQEPCLNIAQDGGGLAASEQHAATCLSLPCHPQMTGVDIDSVITAVNSFRY